MLASTAPIALPGRGSVTDRGTASYTIPLRVPDGVHGMTPELSIAYTGSAAFNGRLGVGFVLAGLSVIAPCRATHAADGRADGPDFALDEYGVRVPGESDDLYCLDGQKLVPHPWIANYLGNDDRLFHTEVESYQRVVAHGLVSDPDATQSVQPTGFTVYGSDGGRREYEPVTGKQLRNANAATTPAGAGTIAIQYRLKTAYDRNNNRIEYVYENGDAKLGTDEVASRIARIDYAFDGAQKPQRQIRFLYSRRLEEIVEYHWGVKVVDRNTLSAIEMYAPAESTPTTGGTTELVKAWEYLLAYAGSKDTGRSVLSSVRMREATGVESWARSFAYTTAVEGPPLVVHPQSGDREFDGVAMGYDHDSIMSYWAGTWFRPNDTRLMLFDIDADGDDDAIYRTSLSGLEEVDGDYKIRAGKLAIRISNGGAPLSVRHDMSQALEPGLYEAMLADSVNSPTPSVYAYLDLGKSRIADFNYDGHQDLMLARTVIDEAAAWDDDPDSPTPNDYTFQQRWTSGTALYAGYPSNGIGDAPYKLSEHTGLDEAAVTGAVFRRSTFNREFFMPSLGYQRVLADLDGDGRVDVIDPFLRAPNDTSGPIDTTSASIPNGVPEASYRATRSTAPNTTPVGFDFEWACGNGFATPTDIDGDGRQDVLVASDVPSPSDPWLAGVYHRLALDDSGTGFHSPNGTGLPGPLSSLYVGPCHGPAADLVFGDWNGDGLTDVLYPPGSYIDPTLGNPQIPNPDPVVRWNYGTSFGPAVMLPVHGEVGITALMRQDVPLDRNGSPVRWDRGTRVADVDGDGRSDIVAFREDLDECVAPFQEVGAIFDVNISPECTNTMVVFRSRGDSFVGEVLFSTQSGFASLAHGFTTAQLGDVTGDGALDAVMMSNQQLLVLELPWRTAPDLLETVSDSGAPVPLETFGYTRSWWGDGPRAEGIVVEANEPGACAWPVACRRAGRSVVRKHTRFVATAYDGTRMVQTELHRYTRPRVSLNGRGFLGYGTHEIWERERGAWTKRIFGNDRSVTTQSGAQFFPTSSAPDEEIRVVPRTQAMTPAQLVASADNAPGMVNGKAYPVVTTWTRHTYEYPASENPRILRMRRSYTRTSEVEQTARVSTTDIPRFTVSTETGTGSRTETWFAYDEFGNAQFDTVTTRRTEIRDGFGGGDVIHRKLVTRPEHHDASAPGEKWLLGLPAYEAYSTTTGSVVPTRVTRRTFYPSGDVHTETTAATNDPACTLVSCETTYTTTTFGRDTRGNVTSVSTSDGTQTRTRTVAWDDVGIYPEASTDAVGLITKVTMHPWFGTPSSQIDIHGITESIQYDGFGRVRATNRVGAPGLTRTYTVVGNKLEVLDTLTDGSKRYERFDEAGRVVDAGQRGSNGNAWSYGGAQYDSLGNRVATMYPTYSLASQLWTTTIFNRRGEAMTTTTPDHDTAGVLTTKYSPGLITSATTDPAGHVAYVKRDPAGRTIETWHMRQGAPYGKQTYTYGPFDRIATTTDAAGHQTVLEHDIVAKKIVETTPNTGTTTSFLDGFGQVKEKRFANGDVVTNTYDAAGRIGTTTAPEGTTTRTYDTGTGAAGKLSVVTSPDGVGTAYGYDTYGRLRSIVQNVDGDAADMVFRYDAYGRLRYAFYPSVANHARFTVRYDYGADGHLLELRNVSACNISTSSTAPEQSCTGTRIWRITARNAAQQVTAGAFGPQSKSDAREYGPTGLLRKQTTNAFVTEYEYSTDGLLERRVEGGREETYAHDELHRLVSWNYRPASTATQVVNAYVYDEIGNLTSATVDAQTAFTAEYGWNARPHAIRTSTTAASYDYDGKGRQIAAGSRTVDYNSLDLPTEIVSGRTTTSFRYDGAGMRAVKKTETLLSGGTTTSTTRYLGRAYEHRIPSTGDEVHVFYVHADGELVAQAEYSEAGEQTRYAIADRLGTPTMYLASGTAERQYFDPFGQRINPTTGAAITDADRSTTRGFTGHEDENSASLVNMQGRIYDRRQFRFLTPDPIVANPWFGQSYNPYSYVLNNPVNLIDPSGFAPEDGTVEHADGTIDPLPADHISVRLDDGSSVPDVPREPSVDPAPADRNRSDESRGGGSSESTDWELYSGTRDLARRALSIASDGARPWHTRAAAGLGLIAVAPVYSVEQANHAGANAVLSVAQSTYESYGHAAKAHELWAAGASEGALDQALQAAQANAIASVKAALLIASTGAAEPARNAYSAYRLGRALKLADQVRPRYWEAHHIVPARLMDPYAAASRSLLRRWNIDINSAENGVFLPGHRAAHAYRATPHAEAHAPDLMKHIWTGLSRARSREEAVNALENVRQMLLR